MASPTKVEPRPVGSGPGPIAQISARQRKQVYLHSAIFDSHGVPTQSVYAKGKQTAVLGQVQQQLLRGPPTDQALTMPSPADIRATVNQGNNVITWDMSAAQRGVVQPQVVPGGQDVRFVRFGEAGEQMKVVTANKDTGAIQREFATLDWADVRCERMRQQNTGSRTERSGLDASGRKMQDLSSEVLGNNRRTEKSTVFPSKEIRSVHSMNVHSQDSVFEKQVAAAASVAGTAESVGAAEAPLSARERRNCHLGASQSSQFTVHGRPKGDAKPLDGSQSARCLEEVGRRRQDRNYSDIFGPSSGASPQHRTSQPLLQSRCAAGFGETAGGDVIYRPHVSAMGKEQKEEAKKQDPVLPITPRAQPVEKSPQAKKLQIEERACWDTRAGMELGAEIARRHHDRMTKGDEESNSRARSASERKRQEMGSRNMGLRMGLTPTNHQDVGSPRVDFGNSKAACASPRKNPADAYRNLRANYSDLARSRKLSSLQSTGIF